MSKTILDTNVVSYLMKGGPLAEAYALIFLAPLCVTILSTLVLKEKVGPWRWLRTAPRWWGGASGGIRRTFAGRGRRAGRPRGASAQGQGPP